MRTLGQASTAGRSIAARRRPAASKQVRSGSSHAAQSWAMVAAFLFGALRLNAMLTLGALPLVLLCVLAANPLSATPALILALYLAMPILTVAFCAFRDAPVFHLSEASHAEADGAVHSWWNGFTEQEMLRPALRALRATAPRVLLATALPMGAALVLVVDAQWALGQSWGLVVAPALLIGALLSLITSLGVSVLISERADARVHVLVRTAAYAALRSFPFTVLSLLVLGIGLLGLIWQPILCWALASSLILYVVWANTRWSIKPALRAS